MPTGTDIYFISGARKRRPAMRGPYIPNDLTADSEPDFDEWGPDDYWSCAAFLQWFQLMKAKYGEQTAVARFKTAWETAWTFGSYHQSCCQDSQFRAAMQAEGIDVDTLTCALLMPVVDTASNALQTASNTTKFIKSVVPWLLGGIVVGGTIYGVNKYVIPSFKRK